jgi:putative oxidoreductase
MTSPRPARAIGRVGRVGRGATRVVGRALIAAAFVHGGAATLNDPGPRAEVAADFLARLRGAIPWLPADLTLVRLNAAAQVAAGTLLATGAWERQTAQVLAASLVPTTIAGHPAWAAADPESRAAEAIQLGKNLGLLGGLLLLACGWAGQSQRQQTG